jgi:hypothetical protein
MSKRNTRSFKTANKIAGNENCRPVEESSEVEAEDHYGELTLERVVILTRNLGRLGWGAQVLALVNGSSTSRCPECGTLIAPIEIGDLRFDAEIEKPFGEQFIVNLIAEHECDSADYCEERQ